eukprot:scaffold103911_cov21-Tisochrysis_lutea.AAC.1
MVETPIQDARLSVAGEQARIMARALAMKDVLVQQDPTVADMLGLVEVPAEEVQGPWNQGHTTTHSTTHVPPPASPAAAAPAAGAEGTAQAGAAAVQPSCSGDGCRAPSPPAAANTRSSTGRLGSTSPS